VRKTLTSWFVGGAVLWLGAWAAAQTADAPPTDIPPPIKEAGPPEMSQAALQAMSAAYLTDEEKKDLRVFHGVWQPGDLDTPARRARAALTQGVFDDPSLADPSTPVEDRAEGMLARGELKEAVAALVGRESVRAVRIRAAALEGLGQFEAAAREVDPVVRMLETKALASASDLTDGVLILMIRARVHGQEQKGGGDFRAMMGMLARARDDLDPLYWPARLAEAELLYEKDNWDESQGAAVEVLKLNPSASAAWALLGQMSVDAFDFAKAESVAARLDRLARSLDSAQAGAGLPELDPEEPLPGSALADLMMTRARLRQNDPDGAEARLTPTLERFPSMRPALALRAAIAAERYDFAAADRLLAEFDALSPGSPEALLAVGKAVSENRQYAQASKYLEQAAARQPNLSEPLIELGLMELQAGRDPQALAALRKATLLDSFNVRAANSLKLVEELQTYSTVESEHFVVRYKPGIDGVLAPEMLGPLEKLYARVTGKGPGGIDFQVPGKTLIELMPDHAWFAVRITGMGEIHTIAASTGPVIAMESPQAGPGHSVGAYDWPRVIQHEFTHTVTLARTANRIPHWFTEAAAVYLEDSPRDYSRCQLLANALREGELFDMDEISIKFVRPEKPTDRAQAYAQGNWMYEYIIVRWGERAPLDLMDRYAQGQRQDTAFRAVLGLSPEEFLAQFKVWAREQVVAWGMLPRPGQPSLGQLLLRGPGGTEDVSGVRRALQGLADGAAWTGVGGSGIVAAFKPDVQKPDASAIDRWLAEYPDQPDVLETALQMRLEAAEGKPDASMIPLLERYAEARPVDPMPHMNLARLYLGSGAGGPGADPSGGPERAIPHLEFLDAREQHSGAYAIELARRYAALGDWDSASAKAERATRVSPFDAEAREFAATVALKRGDLKTAERHIVALTLIEPDREIHEKRLEAVRGRMKAGK
jgi:tetratricopeptide (TPR) repeat protein